MNVLAASRKRMSHVYAEHIRDNPVIVKEFRTRMRGSRAFSTIAAYVILMSIVAMIACYISSVTLQSTDQGSFATTGGLGMTMFKVLTWSQTVLLFFIIPALTSGSISMEIEKRTIETAALTRLSAARIVTGKQISGFVFAVMLLICSLPLSGLCMMFGGVSPAEIAVTYLVTIAWAFLYSAVGVFWSSILEKTATATLVSYATCGLHLLLLGVIQGEVAPSLAYYPGLTNWTPAFSLMTPGPAPTLGMMYSTICGVAIPVSLISIAVNTTIGVLLMYVAFTHVKHIRADKALPIRLLLLAITAAVCFMSAGDAAMWKAIATLAKPQVLSGVGSTVLILMILGASIFATGEPTSAETRRPPILGFSCRRMFKADLAGSVAFLLLWAAIAYLASGVALYLGSLVKASYTLPADFWIKYMKVGAVIVSVTLAAAAIGTLMSRLGARRGMAVVITIFFGVLVYAVYGSIEMCYVYGRSNPHSPIWQLASLWPLGAMRIESGQGINIPLHRPGLAWLICSSVHSILGLALLVLIPRLKARSSEEYDD